MDKNENPYASPACEQTEPAKALAVVDFLPIMQRWEKLRWLYNGLLIVFVNFVSITFVPQHILDPDFWICLCFGGVIANLCFFAGPAIEAYGKCLRLWNDRLAILLFVAGLGFTALLAAYSIAIYKSSV